MEVETSDTAAADVKTVDTEKPEVAAEAGVIDAKIDGKNPDAEEALVLCESSTGAPPDSDQTDEAATVAASAVNEIIESDEKNVEATCATPTDESESAPKIVVQPASESDAAIDTAPIVIPLGTEQAESEPVQSPLATATPPQPAEEIVDEPPSSQLSDTEDIDSDGSVLIQTGSSQSHAESERETDVATDDNDEADITKDLYKDENLLQILSSSPERPEPEIPTSQSDKWKQDLSSEGEEEIDDELDEEIEDEEEDYDSGKFRVFLFSASFLATKV